MASTPPTARRNVVTGVVVCARRSLKESLIPPLSIPP
jgi:hypothetical protein